MTLLERLKIETRPAHDRIELAMDLDRRIASRDGYRNLLIRFYGFHSAWERAASGIAPDKAFFESRCKATLLAKDLSVLGLTEDEIIRLPQCDPLMPLPSPAAVLGSMYVVEGSTLGGAIIAREVKRKLGLCPETGCAYFKSYGSDIAVMWKQFGAKLLEASSSEADDVIVETAQKTFDVMHDWLCEGS
ncbi:biliverdin-producing heme oxygenase [Microvirga sp. ACRRW]|uniref:biliverdin-producing heme oxygenase n=1 Tax=Microvirga sp. ACRRW TaxID=2918205 RepID=UPI001EF4AA7C|nr:biliverdin-producing heme oxygenase [Microvirga sp. ACRRW]MCG7393760.1 biliverdin-producing heme oxygenase [Microvirga sp. ACRRW]